MKERYWNSIVTSLRYGQCVLVLGPEIPAQRAVAGDAEASVAYTDALKDRLAAELLEDGHTAIMSSSLAGVAQQYEDAEGFGPGPLRVQAAEFYAARSFQPSALHRQLAALPFSLVLSTCHDPLLESAFQSAGKSPITDRYNFRGDRLENPELKVTGAREAPYVYHMFGHYQEPQSLVLSENDLLDFLLAVIASNPPLPNSLRRALQRNGSSFLFVGFGIRHWYLRVLLKVLVRGLAINRTGGSSVAVEPLLQWMPELECQQTILFYQRGTRIEVCDEDLTTFLSELDRRFKKAGGVEALPANPLAARPRVFVSYASEDVDLASRIAASLYAAGFEPWLDKEALRGGDDWNRKIEGDLRDSDYVLVLQTQALVAKTIGYVNKEIAIARDHAQRYRGLAFLIPLVADDLPPEQWVPELKTYQQLPVRQASFDDDVAQIVSTLRRDFQRRAARQ